MLNTKNKPTLEEVNKIFKPLLRYLEVGQEELLANLSKDEVSFCNWPNYVDTRPKGTWVQVTVQ